MKTTIDLPDRLVRMAKQKAIEKGTTFKALVCAGLQKELGLPPEDGVSDPIEQLRAIDAEVWRGVKADTYVRELRKGWK
jgi:hypothetical protein